MGSLCGVAASHLLCMPAARQLCAASARCADTCQRREKVKSSILFAQAVHRKSVGDAFGCRVECVNAGSGAACQRWSCSPDKAVLEGSLVRLDESALTAFVMPLLQHAYSAFRLRDNKTRTYLAGVMHVVVCSGEAVGSSAFAVL